MPYRFSTARAMLLLTALAIASRGFAGDPAASSPMGSPLKLTPLEEILQKTRAARPLLSGSVPPHLASRLGATHFAGKYYLTDKPFILEGLEALQGLGMKVAKLWFSADKNKIPNGYGFNSTWPEFTERTRLADMARMPLFQQAFAMPFETFFLETSTAGPSKWGQGAEGNDEFFADTEQQFYELAKHFLETYRDRDVTFVLQNWEGDWLLRGGTGPNANWESDPARIPSNIAQRIEGMIRWLQARQSGVERARAEVQSSRARVANAIEVNRVWDGKKRMALAERGIPTVATHVLPRVKADLVLWSAYDGCWDMPVSFWQGIEIIRRYAQPSAMFGENNVAIGEIGRPEQRPRREEKEIREFWDSVVGVAAALDIPYVLHWELYCNEPVERNAQRPRGAAWTAEELKGFWLIRPDGSYSYAGQYFKELLSGNLAGNPSGAGPR